MSDYDHDHDDHESSDTCDMCWTPIPESDNDHAICDDCSDKYFWYQ